jgi:3-dehydroquinate dehydratase
MKYKKFKKLAKKHLFVLEGCTYDKKGNKEKQIYGLDELYKQLTLNIVSQQRELLIAWDKRRYSLEEWKIVEKTSIEFIDDWLSNL